MLRVSAFKQRDFFSIERILSLLATFGQRLLSSGLVIILIITVSTNFPFAATSSVLVRAVKGNEQVLQDAFKNRRSNFQVESQGVVTKILSDDRDGSRHQRFILRLSSGQTLLIAHNIDIAPRIDGLKVGDTVSFFGEYEWNPQGGVIHWTHRDLEGRHVAGWIRHHGRTYQ